jgi:hypothetical protein
VSGGVVTQFTVDATRSKVVSGTRTQVSSDGAGIDFTLTPDTDNYTESSGLIWNTAADPNGELDGMEFDTLTTPMTHAIEFGTASPLTMTLTDCDFGTNYSATEDGSVGNETFHFRRTSGTITLNLSGCTGNFGYKTDGATVNIEQSVPVTYTFVDDDTDSPIEGLNVTLGTGPGLVDVIDNVLTNASGVVSVSYTGTTPDTVEGFGQKGSEEPVYKRRAIGGTIAAGTGLVATVRMTPD